MPKSTGPFHSISLKASSSPLCPSASCLRSPKHQLSIDRVTKPISAADGGVCGLGVDSVQKLLLAEVVHAGMPVNEEEPGRGCLTLVRDQQKSGNRLGAV